jgi:hypothetical protein
VITSINYQPQHKLEQSQHFQHYQLQKAELGRRLPHKQEPILAWLEPAQMFRFLHRLEHGQNRLVQNRSMSSYLVAVAVVEVEEKTVMLP